MARLTPHPLAVHPRLSVTELFDVLSGMTIPGGCDDCDAEQRIERVRHLGRVTMVVILHDPACPSFARKTRR